MQTSDFCPRVRPRCQVWQPLWAQLGPALVKELPGRSSQSQRLSDAKLPHDTKERRIAIQNQPGEGDALLLATQIVCSCQWATFSQNLLVTLAIHALQSSGEFDLGLVNLRHCSLHSFVVLDVAFNVYMQSFLEGGRAAYSAILT